MATTQTTQRGVDTELKEEMAEMVGATEGDVVYGQVRKVTKLCGEHYDAKIEVVVWIPTDDLIRHQFKQPKPPLEDWKFTRFANTYGHGLVDLDGLVGSQVPVQYEEGWKIVMPEDDPDGSEWKFEDTGPSLGLFIALTLFGPLILPLHLFDALDGWQGSAWAIQGAAIILLWVVLPLVYFFVL